ncbi:MAG: TetR/AcrR family transcriptional regulator [Deltaproteobacteria bacterium]|nr:TetR/AcrR family transcriptional regulator [Deltaproteobacteria bacterium]
MTSKKTFKRELKRLNIMQVARSLFLEKKHNAITMDEIARQSGITKKTLYNYFPSKLALYVHVFDEKLQQLHNELTRCASRELPTDKLILALFNTLFTFTKNNEKFMRLFWTLDSDEFGGVIPEELIQRIKIWTKAMSDVVISVVRNGQQEGYLTNRDPALLIHLMSAVNKGIFIHTNKESRFSIADIDPEVLYKEYIALISTGLFKPLADNEKDTMP